MKEVAIDSNPAGSGHPEPGRSARLEGSGSRAAEFVPQSSPDIEATYKAREVEGIVDLYFYRRIGFWLARALARLKFTPTAVTLVGGVFGVIAGHLYYYNDVAVNLAGMLCHVVANAFDNADGQLARLTNQRSQVGRILDPVVDHIVFASIYLSLILRLSHHGFSIWIWLLGIAAALSHGWQAAGADYCRNAYLYFAKGKDELDSVADLANDYRQIKWSEEPWRKFLLGLYFNVMREQEVLLPGVRKLRSETSRAFGDTIPGWFQQRYHQLVRPTFWWWSLLMTNVRMLVLFVVFLLQQPVWFFWLELTLGNLLLLCLIVRQERIIRYLLRLTTSSSVNSEL